MTDICNVQDDADEVTKVISENRPRFIYFGLFSNLTKYKSQLEIKQQLFSKETF